MPRDGSGNYSLPSGNPVVTNTVISSSGWANPTLSDLATALTQSLSRDGQTTPTADLTMGNFKLRNLANAIARTDAVNAGQVQDGGLVTLGSVSGTDTITASTSPAITAYTAGQRFQFIAAGANTTTTVTLNINGLGAKNVTKNGSAALAAGDIPNGAMVSVVYDGTQFQMAVVPAGAFIGVQIFTANVTYTPTPGMRNVIFEVQGGSGGGAGGGGAGAGNVSCGAPGGAGSYARGKFTAAQVGASQAVTVGLAGTAASNSAGGNGGSSSVGALITAPGGNGGGLSNNIVVPALNGNGTVSSAPTGANIFGARGVGGTVSLALSATVGIAGSGGNSVFGPGAAGPTINTTGITSVNYGAGGSGVVINQAGGSAAGGAGFQGVVLAWEYA